MKTVPESLRQGITLVNGWDLARLAGRAELMRIGGRAVRRRTTAIFVVELG
jgi:hypothetical protein